MLSHHFVGPDGSRPDQAAFIICAALSDSAERRQGQSLADPPIGGAL